MSHLYPIAETAEEALTDAKVAALTRYEAEALADGREIERLETEWLTREKTGISEVIDAADAGPGLGFVQQYEDESGAPVLAVTYWKLGAPTNASAKPDKPADKPKEVPEDHTDDLYFRQGRTKPARKRGRKKYIDPRQMDMFGSSGAEEE